jgi:membrane protein
VRGFARRVYDKAGDDNIFFLAGAIAFNIVVAIVPLLLFAVGIAGVVLTARFGDPATVLVNRLLDYIPAIGGSINLV